MSFRVKQFLSISGSSTSWACSSTPPATKLMWHRMAGRSTPLHEQQEKHDLRLLTDDRLERQAVQWRRTSTCVGATCRRHMWMMTPSVVVQSRAVHGTSALPTWM